MKLCLSKKKEREQYGKRHLVLVCESIEEAWDANHVIREEILPPRTQPIREKTNNGKVLYRMNLEKYLDPVSLAFPKAEFSDGIRKRLNRAEEKRLKGFEVPEDLVIPYFSGRLYDFQKIGVDQIVKHNIPFLNDEMGLGKTFIALAVACVRDAFPLLVVCPNSVKYTWGEVIEEFFDLTYQVVDGSAAQRDSQIRKEVDVVIINSEGVRAKPIRASQSKYSEIIDWEYTNPALYEYVWGMLVVDEYHRMKNPQTQISRGFLQLDGDDQLFMSGTPILNRPEEAWTPIHKLYPDDFDSYYQFEKNLVIKQGYTTIGYRVVPMMELRDFMREKSLRRRKEHVIKDLPDVVRSIRRIDLDGEQETLYKEIRDDILLRLEDGSIKQINGILPHITRLKQACFSPELYGGSPVSRKVEEVKEIVKELVDNEEKAIVFSQWTGATRILQRELEEYNPAYVTGEVTSMKERQREIRRFNKKDDCHVYIGTIDANREGINLGVATYVIFTDLGWTPAGHEQAIARSAAGGLRGLEAKGVTVNVIEVKARDTIEDRIDELLKLKKGVFDRMVERDAGRKIKEQHVTLKDIRDLLVQEKQEHG